MSCKNTTIPICQNLAAPDFTPALARKGPDKRQGQSSGFSTETEKRASGLRRGGVLSVVSCQGSSQEQTLAISTVLGASFLSGGVKDEEARDSEWSRFVYDGEYEVIVSGFLRHGWGSAVM